MSTIRSKRERQPEHHATLQETLLPPAEPDALAESDVRAIVRLLGTVSGSIGSPNERKRTLMRGFAELVGAKAWVWGLGVRLESDTLPTWLIQLQDGFNDTQMAAFFRAQEHPDMTRLSAPFVELLAARRTHITRLRQQTDPDDLLRRSPAYRLWVAAGVVPGILSCRPIDSNTVSTVSLYRGPEAPLFTERESRIAHIVLTEIPWLYESDEFISKDPAHLPHLSPRCHTVFNLLLLGHHRQEIAENLNISIHTTNDYVKTVFRHFNVRSQIELIRRFSQGDGGDGD